MTTPSGSTRIGPAADESYTDTVRRLAAAQKSGKGAPAYSRFVNRKLGRLFAAAGFHLGLTPNGITAVSAAFSFAGIILLATVEPSWWLGVLITVLLVLGYALDAADGQLARLRGGGSVTGEWLDHMVDCLKISTLHMCVLISFYRFWDIDERWLLVPIGYAIVAAVSFFAQILNEQLVRNAGLKRGTAPSATSTPDERPSVVVSLLKIPTDYGLLCLIFVLLGAADLFLAAYTLMFIGSAAYLLAATVKWFGQMRDLDRGGS
ncbi:CDP-alcohol phosphatidyltransferase family protein [Dermatobacter hominis]|uniref:CDP-alcohol phosphatidyltransferase family protein n=1 Tax=Dermatobacter hominis TaxID=2884263 RepID=UPI001D124110|nr:CDP-alcohol phosphatidyltransferase family protein [Dermatobacter hominis]UDY35501.1 CDP-alcohol phosphatidyltransferase family protein [Dermatobacter hominis]